MKANRTCRRLHGPPPSLTGLAILALISGAFEALASRPVPPVSNAGILNAGDILYADSGNAIDGGVIVKVDSLSGEQVVLSSGGLLVQPFAPAIDQSGAIVVSDTSGRLIRIDPATGLQSLLMDNSAGMLGMPCGIGLDRRGGVLIANTQAIVRLDPATGQVLVLSSGGYFVAPIGVVVSATSEIFVLNTGVQKQIIRVNPKTGVQKVISEGGYFQNPQAMALVGSELYVTDVATPDGNFGIGRVLQVDVQTGAQTVIAEGGYLVGPVGIAGDSNGDLIVADPYVINSASPTLYDGGIVRIDPVSGAQSLLVRGEGNHINPRGLVTVPAGPKAH